MGFRKQYHRNSFRRKCSLPVLGSVILFLFLCGVRSPLIAQDHLLLSEITLQLTAAEFIEIHNPTTSAISLSNYYLADNQKYPYVPSGVPLDPDIGDFIVQFPPGASINSGQTIVVALNGAGFESFYAQKADFEINDEDAATPNMVNIIVNNPSLTNAGEGIALFYWDGVDDVVQDVDLMNAGSPNAVSEIVDKSDIGGYLPDAHTMPLQASGPPPAGLSTKRILPEGVNEIHSGGNGITGDDETSEDISITWDDDYTIPTPGNIDFIVSGIGSLYSTNALSQIYPNPASSTLNLQIETESLQWKVQIISTMGVIQRSINYGHTGSDIIQIDVSNLNTGIYYIVFRSDKEISVKGVIVSKVAD